MGKPLSYRKACRIVRRLGMSTHDGLAFTVCGGQLVNGETPIPEIAAMNGWLIEEVAEAAIENSLPLPFNGERTIFDD